MMNEQDGNDHRPYPLEDSGRYVLTAHALEEMAADGLEESEVEDSVLSGRITRTQRDHRGRRKYTIEGRAATGRWVRTVCRYSDSGEHIVIITVYEAEGAET